MREMLGVFKWDVHVCAHLQTDMCTQDARTRVHMSRTHLHTCLCTHVVDGSWGRTRKACVWHRPWRWCY